MTETTIPDSIEPYIGYKSLLVYTDRGRVHLRSPQQQHFLWPRGTKACARCNRPPADQTWGWVAVQHGQIKARPVPHMVYHAQHLGRVLGMMVPLPENPPPKGCDWSWEHHIAGEHCQCGIYVVSEVEDAWRYFGEHHVFVKVALWGRVTIGTRGARGEFAYPQEIISSTVTNSLTKKIAEEYSIPILDVVQNIASSTDALIVAMHYAATHPLPASPTAPPKPPTPPSKPELAFNMLVAPLLIGSLSFVIGKTSGWYMQMAYSLVACAAWAIYLFNIRSKRRKQ